MAIDNSAMRIKLGRRLSNYWVGMVFCWPTNSYMNYGHVYTILVTVDEI